jgi:hypothetical protein
MIAYPFLYLIFSFVVSDFSKRINSKSIDIILTSIAGLAMMLSTFWTNPYPYTNAWDSNLKIINYFKIQKQMLEKVKQGTINPQKTYSTFPLHKNFKYAYVNDEYDIQFQEYGGANLNKGELIIYSNIFSNLELAQKQIDSNIVFDFEEGNAWVQICKTK